MEKKIVDKLERIFINTDDEGVIDNEVRRVVKEAGRVFDNELIFWTVVILLGARANLNDKVGTPLFKASVMMAFALAIVRLSSTKRKCLHR